jgi:hypothetical protein
MTNPAHQLLVAHLGRLENTNTLLTEQLLDAHARNATLRREKYELQTALSHMRTSRDRWRSKHLARSHYLHLLRVRHRRQRLRAESWKTRAIQQAER